MSSAADLRARAGAVLDRAAVVAGLMTQRDASGDRLLERIAGRRSPLQAASYDAPRVAGHTSRVDEHGVSMPAVSDPTGEAAAAVCDDRDRAVVADQLAVALDALDEILLVAAKHPPAQQVARVVDEPAEQCESCRRVGRRFPMFRRTNMAGALDRRYALCRWCHDWASQWRRLPPRRVLEAHHAGQRIRVRGNEILGSGGVVLGRVRVREDESAA